MKNFTYDLEGELLVVKNGSKEPALQVVVNEPKNKILIQVSLLEQEFAKAQQEALSTYVKAVGKDSFDNLMAEKKSEKAEKEETEGEKVSTPKEIIDVLMSGNADLVSIFDAFKKILKLTAKVDDIKITDTIYDDLTPKDTKNLLGLYYINFTTASQNS